MLCKILKYSIPIIIACTSLITRYILEHPYNTFDDNEDPAASLLNNTTDEDASSSFLVNTTNMLLTAQ